MLADLFCGSTVLNLLLSIRDNVKFRVYKKKKKTFCFNSMLELIDFFGTREKGNWRNS
jgi:hypothetical protein